MVRRALAFLFALSLCSIAVAYADEGPTYKGPLTPTEQAFVTGIQADLMQRFPTAKDAIKAGYVRYTSEDPTGAISYANLQWNSPDPKHPSQLWYDKNGNLLGADFSQLATGNDRPSIFGVNPGRLYEFSDHIHYVLKDGDGDISYDQYIYPKDFTAKGGLDPKHPTAQDIVRIGRANNASEVLTVFDMPSIWDMIVWVKPNPDGAFAEKNPNVTP